MTNPPASPDPSSMPPQEPAYGQAPGQEPVAQPPKKSRKKLFLGLGGGCCGLILLIVIIVVIAGLASGGSDDDSAADSGSSSSEAADSSAAEEDAAPAEDSEQEATEEEASDVLLEISEVERATEIGDEYFTEEAQGEYVVVHFTFTNNANEAVDLMSSEFRLLGADGTEYAETMDGAMAYPDNYPSYETINPGNTYEGVVVFDVPEGTEVTTLIYQSTWSFSGPLEVELP